MSKEELMINKSLNNFDKGIVNMVPILYIVVPILIGLIISKIFKIRNRKEKILPVIIIVVINIIYILIISIKTKSLNEYFLGTILFMWNNILSISTYYLLRIISRINKNLIKKKIKM